MNSKGISIYAICLLGSSVIASGCFRAASRPDRTVHDYAELLRDKDFERAYSLMSEEYQREVSQEQFAELMKRNSVAVEDTLGRLDRNATDVRVSAVITFSSGDELPVIEEGGRWKIAANPLLFYSQATPRQAIRSFVRAYKLKRWSVLLRFVPERYAKSMTIEKIQQQFEGAGSEELAGLIETMEANLGRNIEQIGDEARMSYGEEHEVVLVRELGRWRIREVSEGQ